MRVTHLDT